MFGMNPVVVIVILLTICSLAIAFFIVLSANNCSSFSLFKEKITTEKIKKDLPGRFVGEDKSRWRFEQNAPRYIELLDSKYDGNKATIYIFIRTVSLNKPAGMEGKIRLIYEYAAGEWNLVELQNISTKKIDEKHAKRLQESIQFPLHFGAAIGDIELVKRGLNSGALVDSKEGTKGSTPLMFAAQFGYEDIVRLLVDKGADVNAKNNSSLTPLMSAAYGGQIENVRFLVEKGADVNAKNNDSWTPLVCAAWRGDEEIIRFLVEKGADVNAKYESPRSPLTFAALKGQKEIVRFLVEMGADVNIKHKHSETPLMYAAHYGQEEIVRFLVQKDADVNAKDNNNDTALDIAKKQNHQSIVEFLSNR